MTTKEYVDTMIEMIKDLKSMCTDLGLSNTGDEYKIIGELFTYKFLNDKLTYEFETREDKNESFDDFIDYLDIYTAKMKQEHLIKNLFHRQNEPNFHKILDAAFIEVDKMNKKIYSIETTSGTSKPLFEPLSAYIRDSGKELELSKRAINILDNYTFTEIFNGGFDYFSTIFEYLIKDYNKDSGKYAEYFTPLFAGNIMADILYNDTPVNKVSLYDPSAGSGTLLLALANKIGTDNCTIYSQDISQKSTQFLRINLILNKLVHSLENVVEGNTLTNPEHTLGNNLLKFDYIVSNPPFKMDFSNMVPTLKINKYNRFFAGIPNIPKKDTDKMAVYLMFLQHIIASLSDRGKAAIVVPTIFTTASASIPKKIRQHLVEEGMLRGVIHMPPNIFANTGTSVSILFIDKTKTDDKIILLDASNLGKKVTLEDGQRTILSPDEIEKIQSYFKQQTVEPEFSVVIDKDDLNDEYLLQASHYYEVIEKIMEFDITEKISEIKKSLIKSLEISKTNQVKVLEILNEECIEPEEKGDFQNE